MCIFCACIDAQHSVALNVLSCGNYIITNTGHDKEEKSHETKGCQWTFNEGSKMTEDGFEERGCSFGNGQVDMRRLQRIP